MRLNLVKPLSRKLPARFCRDISRTLAPVPSHKGQKSISNTITSGLACRTPWSSCTTAQKQRGFPNCHHPPRQLTAAADGPGLSCMNLDLSWAASSFDVIQDPESRIRRHGHIHRFV
ncbi:hypothetical protein ACQRIT_005912 [Beauveria bassiana]